MKTVAPRSRTVTLPPPAELERICKGLATLDAIACEEWDDRAYSFDAKWDKRKKLRLASMRNGSGDGWFLLFAGQQAFLKASWHEHPLEDVAEVYAGIPDALAPQLEEPAFEVEQLTFGGFHDGERWTLRGKSKPLRDELALLSGVADPYRRYASEAFEVDLPLPAIERVLAGSPLDASLLRSLRSRRTLRELESDLVEIVYGR